MNKLSVFNKTYIIIITFIGIFLRILWIINIRCIPISDFATYQKIATNIFMNKGNSYMGLPVAFQAPGYTMTLGYFYKLFSNNSILLGEFLNVILSSLTLIVVFFILLKLFRSIPTVLLAYTLTALNINYIAYNSVLGSEILFTFLFTLIILLELSNIKFLKKYSLIGFVLALSALTKPNFLIYILVIFVVDWLKDKDIKLGIKKFFITLSVFVIFLAPWTYRNFKAYHQLIPVSYNGGYVLFINNNNNNTTGAWMPISQIHTSKETQRKLKKAGFKYTKSVNLEVKQVMLMPKLQNIFSNEATNWILSHPIKFFNLGIHRLKNTFFSGAADIYMWCVPSYKSQNFIYSFVKSNNFKKLGNFNINLLSICGLIYILINIKNIIKGIFNSNISIDYSVSIPVINLLFFGIITFAFEGQARYNFPVLFIFTICFSNFIITINEKLKTVQNPQFTIHSEG